ncbi:MAG: hypothetical protein ACLRTQ_09365 [Candidatus Borkfalkia sp.]
MPRKRNLRHTGTMVSNPWTKKIRVYPVYLNTDGEMFADKRLRTFPLFRSSSEKAGGR